MGRFEGGFGILRVVQGLAEDGEVDRGRIQRRGFEIAQAEFEVLDAVLARLGRAEGDDFLGIVHRDHFLGAAGQEFTDQTLARAQVGDAPGLFKNR